MSHQVTVLPSGHRFMVEPGILLDAALQAGVMLPYSCKNGACASCKGRLLGAGSTSARTAQGAEPRRGRPA